MNDKKTLKALYGTHNPPIPTDNALLAQILSRAREFNSPLFTNATFITSLLALSFDDEVTPPLYTNLSMVVKWIIQSEQNAQLS